LKKLDTNEGQPEDVPKQRPVEQANLLFRVWVSGEFAFEDDDASPSVNEDVRLSIARTIIVSKPNPLTRVEERIV
jgi:hypothetical protein